MTRSHQQLSQENLLEVEKEVAKPYTHKLLEPERLSPNRDYESQPDSLFNHGFIMFPLDKLAKLSPSLAKYLRKFFDQFSKTEHIFVIPEGSTCSHIGL